MYDKQLIRDTQENKTNIENIYIKIKEQEARFDIKVRDTALKEKEDVKQLNEQTHKLRTRLQKLEFKGTAMYAGVIAASSSITFIFGLLYKIFIK